MENRKIRVQSVGEMFPGFATASRNFDDIRTQSVQPLLYVDIDLTSARTIAAATAGIVPIAGTVFYVDPNPSSGFATVYLTDKRLTGVSAPLYVGPGSIIKVPFDQLLIENTAQPGRVLRIIYGTDVDFEAGAGQNVNATIVSPLNGGWVGMWIATISSTYIDNFAGRYSSNREMLFMEDLGTPSGVATFSSNVAFLGNTPENVFGTGSNTFGALIWRAEAMTRHAGHQMLALSHGTVAPGAILANPPLATNVQGGMSNHNAGTTNVVWSFLKLWPSARLASGRRLDWITETAETAAGNRHVEYSLLTS